MSVEEYNLPAKLIMRIETRENKKIYNVLVTTVINGKQRTFCLTDAESMKDWIREVRKARQVTGKLKQPCPCDTCQTRIDRCGCQMHLCSDYQKWKEGEAE